MLSVWRAGLSAALMLLSALGAPAFAADPIKVGFSMALTGSVAQNGKQLLLAINLWRDDVNAKGGLLGRPVELVYYDDQSNPSNVPGIYTKLISVDKVDLLLGPYATNMAAAAMPVIIQNNKVTIGILAVSINRHFNYSKYFSMQPLGPDGVRAFSKGFFDLAAAQSPKPQTVAFLSADAEFARTSADGARENATAAGFKIVYDQSYPPPTTDFAPTVRAIQAANPDIVFVAAYPPDTVGIVRAANEIGLTPKMFGGTMIGLLITPIKDAARADARRPRHHGKLRGGADVQFPRRGRSAQALSRRCCWRKDRSAGLCVSCRSATPPARCWRRPWRERRASISDKLAEYIHSHKFSTVVGEIAYGKDGEWTEEPHGVHAIPERGAERCRAVRRRQGPAGGMAAAIQDRRYDLSVRRRPAEIKAGQTKTGQCPARGHFARQQSSCRTMGWTAR